MKTFHLFVAEVGKTLFEGNAKQVTVPSISGILTILADHEALVAPLKEGEIIVVSEQGDTYSFLITDGVLEISDNNVSILL